MYEVVQCFFEYKCDKPFSSPVQLSSLLVMEIVKNPVRSHQDHIALSHLPRSPAPESCELFL